MFTDTQYVQPADTMGPAPRYGNDDSTQLLESQVYRNNGFTPPSHHVASRPELESEVHFLDHGKTDLPGSSSPPMSLPAPGPPKTPIYAGKKRDCHGNFTDPPTTASTAYESFSAFKRDIVAPLTQLFQTTQAADDSSSPAHCTASDQAFDRPSPLQQNSRGLDHPSSPPPLGSSLDSQSFALPLARAEDSSNIADRPLQKQEQGSQTKPVNRKQQPHRHSSVLVGHETTPPRDPRTTGEAEVQSQSSGETIVRSSQTMQCKATGPLKTPGRTCQNAIILSSDGKKVSLRRPSASTSDDEGILSSRHGSTGLSAPANSGEPISNFAIPDTRTWMTVKGSKDFGISVADSQKPSSPDHSLSTPNVATALTARRPNRPEHMKARDSPFSTDGIGISWTAQDHTVPETSPAAHDDARRASRKPCRHARRGLSELHSSGHTQRPQQSARPMSPRHNDRSRVSEMANDDLVLSSPPASKTKPRPVDLSSSGNAVEDNSCGLGRSLAAQTSALQVCRESPRRRSQSKTWSQTCPTSARKTTSSSPLDSVSTTPSAPSLLSESKEESVTDQSAKDVRELIPAMHRVWACFQSSPKGPTYYPASCLRPDSTQSDHFIVRFDDGTEKSLGRHLIRSLDLRNGDPVKVDENGRRGLVFTVDHAEAYQSALDPTQSGIDVNGNRIVFLTQRSGRKSLGTQNTHKTEVSCLYLIPSLWPSYENRSFGSPDMEPGCLDVAGAQMIALSRSDEAAASYSSRHPPTAPTISSLFRGIAFASSSSRKGDSLKKQTMNTIQLNSGRILDGGLDDLFVGLPPDATVSDSDLTSNALKLRPTHESLHFVVLLADTHLRTAKYLHALALNIPCLSFHWALDCVERGSIVPWTRYLLPAGDSSLLGGAARSRVMRGPLGNSTACAGFPETVQHGPRFLQGLSFVILLGRGKNAEEQQEIVPVVAALGASRIFRATDVESVDHLVMQYGPVDFVCVGHLGAMAPKGQFRVIDRDKIVQSLIVGEFLDR